MNAALEFLLKLLRVFEGCRLCAYRDIVGIWTICYGSTTGVKEGQRKTQAECEALLASEAGRFMLRVLQLAPNLVNSPARLAAVTSLAYNIGTGALRASTLLRKCKAGQWSAASAQFPRWDKAGGKPVRGLQRRRAAERVLFDSERG